MLLYHKRPPHIVRTVLTSPSPLSRQVMAYFFYSGWLMFPVLFVVGPEGAGHLSVHGSTIGHSIADLLSKQAWGICEYLMENKLHVINERLEMEEEEEEAKLASVGAANAVRRAACSPPLAAPLRRG